MYILTLDKNLVWPTFGKLGNQKPEIGNRKSKIGNRKSEIRNRKSEIVKKKTRMTLDTVLSLAQRMDTTTIESERVSAKVYSMISCSGGRKGTRRSLWSHKCNYFV